MKSHGGSPCYSSLVMNLGPWEMEVTLAVRISLRSLVSTGHLQCSLWQVHHQLPFLQLRPASFPCWSVSHPPAPWQPLLAFSPPKTPAPRIHNVQTPGMQGRGCAVSMRPGSSASYNHKRAPTEPASTINYVGHKSRNGECFLCRWWGRLEEAQMGESQPADSGHQEINLWISSEIKPQLPVLHILLYFHRRN